jgi:hypothetical protein
MSGISVNRHKVLVYTIAGLLAGIAALVLSSKNLTAQAGMGVMSELDAIAMAVIGGISQQGGRGSILGTVIGALIFGVIISGFTFKRLDAYYQENSEGRDHRRCRGSRPVAAAPRGSKGLRGTQWQATSRPTSRARKSHTATWRPAR